MSASETIERLRRSGSQLWGRDGDDEWLRRASALLDIAEAAERLRGREIHGALWPQDREGWCCGCGGSMLGDGGPFHAPDCSAIALDRALDALGGE